MHGISCVVYRKQPYIRGKPALGVCEVRAGRDRSQSRNAGPSRRGLGLASQVPLRTAEYQVRRLRLCGNPAEITPFDGEPLLEQGVELFKAISEAGSTAVLMATWSEKNNPGGQEKIDSAFKALHSACGGSLLAGCGSAWHRLRGKIELYAGDGEHQNPRGAYLNACVLARTVFGIDPSGLPAEIKAGILSAKLTADEIRLLQKTAADI